MRYQLLLAMVLCSVVMAHKRTHMPKRRMSAFSVADNMVTKPLRINVNEVGAGSSKVKVKLGYAINITKFDETAWDPNCVLDVGEVVRSEERHSSSDNTVLNGDNQSLLALNGSLELNVPIEVAELNGKAQMDLNNKKNEKTKSSKVRQVEELYDETIDLRKIPADQISPGCSKITHVVARVIKGKRFEAMMTLSDKSQDNEFSANGSLEVKLKEIPIGGKGELGMKWLSKTEQYNFYAEIKTDGGPAMSSVSTVKDFYNYSRCWFTEVVKQERRLRMTPFKSVKRRLEEATADQTPIERSDIDSTKDCSDVSKFEKLDGSIKGDDTAIVAYELHPISTIPNFIKYRLADPDDLDERKIKDAKQAHSDLLTAYQSLQLLIDKLDKCPNRVLSDKVYAEKDEISDAQTDLEKAVRTGAPTTTQIKAARDHRLSYFMDSSDFEKVKTAIEGCNKKRRLVDQIRDLKRRLRL